MSHFVRFVWLGAVAPTEALGTLTARRALRVWAFLLLSQLLVYGLFVARPPAAVMQSYIDGASLSTEQTEQDVNRTARQRLNKHAIDYTSAKVVDDIQRVTVTSAFCWVCAILVVRRMVPFGRILSAVIVAEVITTLAFFTDIAFAATSTGVTIAKFNLGGVVHIENSFFEPLMATPLVHLWWSVSAGSAIAAAIGSPLSVTVPLFIGGAATWSILMNLRHQLHS